MAARKPRLRLLPPAQAEAARGAAGDVGGATAQDPSVPVAISVRTKKRTNPPNLFHPKYPCRSCEDCAAKRTCRQKKESRTWWCRFSIRGVRRPVNTGCKDERSARVKAAMIRVELEARANGLPVADPEAKQRTLAEALQGYARHLRLGRGGPRQQSEQLAMLTQVFETSGARFIDGLGEQDYAAWAESRAHDGLTNRTTNRRIAALRRFGTWLRITYKLPFNPFEILVKLDERRGARERRAFDFGQMNDFLRATRLRPILDARAYRTRAGVSAKEIVRLRREGRVRSLVYRVIARCGPRPGEITKIEIGHVRLARRTIFVPAHISKARRDEEVLLPNDLVRRLGAYLRTLKGLPSSTPLFRGRVPSVKRFDSDLAAAGILKVEGSRYLDVHALRKTYVTHLRMAGVDADFAQRLARHAGTTLTATVYTDEQLLPLRACMDMLERRDREERRRWQASVTR